MCPRKLDREAALCGADVGEAPIVSPGKFLRNGVRGAKAQPRHGPEELREDRGVAVYLAEQVAALLRLVLRLAGTQGSVSAPQNG